LPSWLSLAAYLAISVALTTNCIARDDQVATTGVECNSQKVICSASQI